MGKAMKKKAISARTAKRQAFAGKIDKTNGGLNKAELVMNKRGKVVSKKQSAAGKKRPWIAAVQAARKELKIKGSALSRRAPLSTLRRRRSTASEQAMCLRQASEASEAGHQLWVWVFYPCRALEPYCWGSLVVT